MRAILLHFENFWFVITSRLKRVRAFISRNKKIGYGSVVAVAVLALPLGVYAFGSIANHDAVGGDNSEMTVKSTPEMEPDSKATVSSKGSENGSGSSSSDESATNSSSGRNDNNVNVTINGQTIPTPENGTVHKRLKDDENKSVVDVTIDNKSSQPNQYGSTSSSTSVDVNQHSYSSSTGEENNTGRSEYRRQPRTPF